MDELTRTAPALLMYIAPLSLILLALFRRSGLLTSAQAVFRTGRALVVGAVGFSLVAAIAVFANGAMISPVVGVGDIGFSLRLDALSVIMLWLVAVLGAFLIQFSRNYLDGDARQAVFLSRLCLTMAAVFLFVLAGNLWQLVAGWMMMSFALHRLLIFYDDRPRAIRAARKKFIVARAGDVVLIAAALLIAQATGTTDIGLIAESTSTMLANGAVPLAMTVAAVFIAIAAILKSAMFPLHGWLLEVMETPTPVSALLHAGLLNAGIFLVVRLGSVVFASTPALLLLILFGGFTALFASTAMIMQSSVKVSLAYSSAAHMGFMLMLCGFGAHSVAIMHLVAHSFYKAHAFLSSGSIIEYKQITGSQTADTAPNPLVLLLNLGIALAIFASIGLLLGFPITDKPYEMALGAIFVIAITHLLIKGTAGKSYLAVMGRTVFMAVSVTLAFFSLELVALRVLGSSVAETPTPNAITLTAMILAVIAFAIVTMAGSLLPAFMHTSFGRRAYVHLKNGLYANAFVDRVLSSRR